MALLKDFTDAAGTEHRPAYWRGVQININSAERHIYAVFYAYKDAAAFEAGKQPLPGGMKDYFVQGAEFMALALSAPQGATHYEALARAVEGYALGKLDTPGGETDGEGQPVMVSFFDGAASV